MNIVIMTDLEGISDVITRTMVNNEGSPEHASAIEYLMRDVNAAVRGAFDGGAKAVYVVDGHGGGNNFPEGTLDERAVHLKGREWDEFIRARKAHGYMEVGAHAKAGTPGAFYEHTQSSVSWEDYLINGKSYGELGQGAIFVGYYDVPFIMVSGDEAACAEAKDLLGDIPVAPVKKAVDTNNAISLPPEQSQELIYNAAKEAVMHIDEFSPFTVNLPLEILLTYKKEEYSDWAMQKPGVERLGVRTVKKTIPAPTSYYDLMF